MILVGNTETLIDWNNVILDIINKSGTSLRYNEQSFDKTIPAFADMDAVWQKAGYQYNDPSIEWINYFPGSDFNQEVVDVFKQLVMAEPWMVWISRIRPGKMAPWHYDAHSKLDELLSLGTPVRYTCYIQEPSPGHVSIVGDSAVYRPSKGSIYKWPNYNAWHCGLNGGLTDKYMFNYWGYYN
jgi:hypothetical protein